MPGIAKCTSKPRSLGTKGQWDTGEDGRDVPGSEAYGRSTRRLPVVATVTAHCRADTAEQGGERHGSKGGDAIR